MKISSGILLRAILAAHSTIQSRPVSPEYGMFRLRSGYGVDCIESFNGSTLLRNHVQFSSPIKLDRAFEFSPAIAWLGYIDGIIDISLDGGYAVFSYGRSKLRKTGLDSPIFPVQQPIEGNSFSVSKDALAQLRLTAGDSEHQNIALDGIHVVQKDSETVYLCTGDGIGFQAIESEGSISHTIVIPIESLDDAFSATGIDTIIVHEKDNHFYVEHDDIEMWFPGFGAKATLDGVCHTLFGYGDPALEISTSDISNAVVAIQKAKPRKKSANDPPQRAKVFTRDGQLFLVGGEEEDFYSMPIAKAEIEIPEEMSKIIFDTRIMSNLLKLGGRLWFLDDPRNGPTKFLVVNATSRGIMMPMTLARGG